MGQCIPANPSAFCGIFPHLTHVFRIHLKILRNHNFYRISLDSHQMDVKSLIQGTLSRSKDDFVSVMLCTIANGACLSGTERKRLRQETGRWIERGRGGAWGGYLEIRVNTKTFLNGILRHVRDDSTSRFSDSRPNVGRYDSVTKAWWDII